MKNWDKLHRAAVSGTLSPLEFLTRAAAIGVAASLTSGLLTSQSFAEETPKKGGNLRIGMEGGSASDSLDPTTCDESIAIMASLAVCNGFVEFNAAGEPTGELVESWEVKPGAKEWIFNVRKDITFSNGKTLDADDCIYSLQLYRGETKSPAKGMLEQITEIKALNPNQVGITLAAGNADFPVILGDYHLIVVPKDFKDWGTLIGTGAYTLDIY